MKYYFTIIKKELLEVVRDKNSFLMSLILLLIMPAIIIGYGLQSDGKNEKILISERADAMAQILQKSDIPYKISSNDISDEIYNSNTPAGIDYINNQYLVMYVESNSALSIIQDLNQLLELQITNTNAKINHSRIIYKKINSQNTEASNELFAVIPVLLILSIMTGTGNGIAVNTFAGEKERGSLETLLLTQVKRSTLFFAKLTTVALSMLMGVMLYVIAILGSIKFINSKTNSLIDEFQISTMCLLIICLSIFCLFIATYISIIALKAHSVKEAQLSTMFLSFFTCGAGIILNEGIIRTSKNIIPLIPIVNIMNILENLFKGNIHIESFILTNVVNIIFIWIGVKIGTHIMNKN